ncbi:MAG TPA: DUF4424 family protein [Thermodesulfovibrionales bacterium]|nr:DUF4424 family protein [Thermodesulfovibrionales bacterium]
MSVCNRLCAKWSGSRTSLYLLLGFLHILNSSISSANEMPLEGFPASGIVVRDEKNIQIEREDLYISRSEIQVSYIFRNTSDTDIVTEIAFPIPAHDYDPTGRITYPLHGDFQVEVGGKKTKHKEMSRALIGKKDVTATLKRLNISFKDFDNEQRRGKVFGRYFNELSKSKQQELIRLGVVKLDNQESGDEPWYVPAWSVETIYHWRQSFPAQKTVSIKHTYTPNTSHTVNGDEDKNFISRRKVVSDARNIALAELLCLNDELKKWEKRRRWMLDVHIVDYILTTANHWKKPIKKFHLVIEADNTPANNERVSTCFENNRLKKINNWRYEMTIDDFIPKDEISVFFLSYPVQASKD